MSFAVVPPISTTRTFLIARGLIAEPDKAADALENAPLLLLHLRRGRPALDNFQCEKTKEGEARELDIEPQILRDLCDRADAVKLRCKLRFRDGQPQGLHTIVTVSCVSRNAARIIRPNFPQLLVLNETQRAKRPLIHISLARHVLRECREIGKLEEKSHACRRPQLREQLLAVMLDELQRWFLQHEILLR